MRFSTAALSLALAAAFGSVSLGMSPVQAADTVATLSALTGATPILLTGDNNRAATALATRVGITDVRAFACGLAVLVVGMASTIRATLMAAP